MNWSKLWISMFGTTEWLGIDIGFWISTGIALLIALIMIVGFWSVKPLSKRKVKQDKK